ncbi:CHAP domain-containing protein [Nocardioides sp. GY 10113]|uniref:CHAP domain-containing protein n=1 Tax=Nocardioides sp. GY 10113 TaxID=2569761 RepID=UPI0010A837FC|nr:CHAP domain-containing protein [Nocardioides sp. GY 10113]TIC83837.1 CHAP domain-containing protein [Nocardioides sp. GY 10113]
MRANRIVIGAAILCLLAAGALVGVVSPAAASPQGEPATAGSAQRVDAALLVDAAARRGTVKRSVRLVVPKQTTQGVRSRARVTVRGVQGRVRVRFKVRYAGQWVQVGSKKTNRRGKATFSLSNAAVGVHRYRVTAKVGSGKVIASKAKRVKVTAALPSTAPSSVVTIESPTPDSLVAGEALRAGEQLVSPNGEYRLVMQGDNNLVIYKAGTGATWASSTVGSGADRLTMQGDGNLVMYQGSVARWNTATVNTGADALQMQDDGNLVLYAGARAIWSTKGGYIGDRLKTGQTLYPGERLYSVGRKYSLVLQGDGNLVLYEGGTARWNTETDGSGANRLVLQGDGNLVLYADATARWATYTVGKGADRLVLQSDRNLVLYSGSAAVWHTHTNVSTSSGSAGGGDDYPAGLRAPVAQDSVVDPWRFYNRECTSWVAWKLNNNNHVQFSNNMTGPNGKSGHFGNAGNWHTNAAAIGYTVNGTPKRGAIAEWSGHVAWVLQVNSDGSIVIEEYNYGYTGLYNKRTVTRSNGWPSWFIHIRDL